MSDSLIDNVSNSSNCYCIYLPSNNPEHFVQFNLLTPNIRKKYKNIDLYFLTSREVINKLNLPKNFIDENYYSLNRNKFGYTEELKIIPKTNLVENYCKQNEIELCVSNDLPNSSANEFVIFTQSYEKSKSLTDKDLEKLKKIFGYKLCVNPENFMNAKYVIGPECYQIFLSAAIKIPTYIISNNGNYVELFLKMFPKHKKLEL